MYNKNYKYSKNNKFSKRKKKHFKLLFLPEN